MISVVRSAPLAAVYGTAALIALHPTVHPVYSLQALLTGVWQVLRHHRLRYRITNEYLLPFFELSVDNKGKQT